MKEIKAIIEPFMENQVCEALQRIDGLPGMIISRIQGLGRAHREDTSVDGTWKLATRIKLELVVSDTMAPRVVDAIAKAAHTGKPGDGKIFVYEVLDVVRIRTGEHGEAAI